MKDDTINSNKETSGSSEAMRKKEWLDPSVIRYPFDFDEEGRPTEALKQQQIMAEAGGDGWLHDRNLRKDLLHFVFDEHEYTHRGTCFKGGKTECRGHLPEMASDD